MTFEWVVIVIYILVKRYQEGVSPDFIGRNWHGSGLREYGIYRIHRCFELKHFGSIHWCGVFANGCIVGKVWKLGELQGKFKMRGTLREGLQLGIV